MEHAKKMLLVEPEMLSRMHRGGPTQSFNNTLATLDNDMNNIMQMKGISDSDKWTQYKQVLQRYLHFASETREPLKIPIVTPDQTVKSLPNSNIDIKNEVDQQRLHATMSLPLASKTKAEIIYDTLKSKSGDIIGWDSTGRVTIKNEPIESSITSLIEDVVKRKGTNLPGWYAFANILGELKIPDDLIVNTERRKYIRTITTPFDTHQSTPRRSTSPTSSPSRGAIRKKPQRGKGKVKLLWKPYRFY